MPQVFFVMHCCITKKVAHYEKPAPETSRLVPETTNKNHGYFRPRSIISSSTGVPTQNDARLNFLWAMLSSCLVAFTPAINVYEIADKYILSEYKAAFTLTTERHRIVSLSLWRSFSVNRPLSPEKETQWDGKIEYKKVDNIACKKGVQSLGSGGSRISQRGVRQLQRWGHQPIIFAKFPQKLHEIEEIWTERGGARPWRPPLDPPMLKASFIWGLAVNLKLSVKPLMFFDTCVGTLSSFIRRRVFYLWGVIHTAPVQF